MKTNLPVTGRAVDFPDDTNILSTTDLKGRITYVNQALINISGFEEEELVGKSHNVVRHPDMPPAAFKMLWDRIQSGHSWMGLVKNRCKNGDHYWVNAYVTPIQAHGQTVEYQSVRTRPNPEQVARAESLYSRLNAGKKLPDSLAARTNLPVKCIAAGVLTSLLIAAVLASGIISLESALPALAAALLTSLLCLLVVMPVHRVVESTRHQVSNDPVARHIYTGRNDEAGQLEYALFLLRSEASAIAGRINDSAQQLSENAERLSQAAQRSSEGLHHQQAETAAIASAMAEMVASISDVARHAQLSADSADGSTQVAMNGSSLMSEAREALHVLSNEIEQTTCVISHLADSSNNIHRILDVITAIAEKTNLLALNAAIEAARAGEQGRGFAVVAEEVRNLALQSQSSVSEIQQLLASLHHDSQEASSAMQLSRQKAETTVERALEAAEALQQIANGITHISDMNTQIASAVEQQLAVSSEVERNVDLIKDVAGSNLENGRETEASVEQMSRMSLNLKQLSDHFWSLRA
ncbi:methyl-accepting chemotaxis protein [Marinobacterium sediminicola]|uniref:Methyl-accepting chemotaxis sensory transducer with Pas/Pac sensor n=1 Tax=Marinobacterium sediminicola TaxID=518898 RepID=A0ABY1RYM5_9GAMM|nr:PAS domain-containing methyl-accepting chemotaxis protein [Marinobacterium sediminicola]ULG68127.1 methyl-accepting chemotaxis protein [Marinobacterium sediminicola]SMR73360.1 methyl-accepting chemotaxis sensory transducer with Pas/Pac sensor [Marinobacterium sediminicola]